MINKYDRYSNCEEDGHGGIRQLKLNEDFYTVLLHNHSSRNLSFR